NNANSTSVLLVEESANGDDYSQVVSLTGSVGLPSTCTTKGPYALNASTRYVRWSFTKGTSNGTIDDVLITAGVATTQILSTDVAALTFGTVETGECITHSFTFDALDLEDDVIISSNSDHFTVSATAGGPFSSSVSVTNTGAI